MKYRFFDAKKAAIERGKGHGRGWMPKFVCCQWCGNPQEICVVDAARKQKAGECVYPDVVLPCSWALFCQENRWGQGLEDISGQAATVCGGESRWMDWLGRECELYSMRACEAVRMADWVMGQIELECTM
jgi:hypothetical protein